MSDQITRKQSYRWESMSHTNYDGASWDDPSPSVSENEWGDDDHDGDATRHTIEPQEASGAVTTYHTTETGEKERSQGVNMDPGVPSAVSGNTKVVNQTQQEGSSHGKRSSARSHPHARGNMPGVVRSSVDQDLDNLMDQISRELQPHEANQEVVEQTVEKTSQKGNAEDNNMGVPATGYFAQMVPSLSDIESRSVGQEEEINTEEGESRTESNPASFQFEPPYLPHNSNANTSSSLSIPTTIDSRSTGFETPTEIAVSERRSVSTPDTLATLTPLSNRRVVSIPASSSVSRSTTTTQKRMSIKRPPPEPFQGADKHTGAGVGVGDIDASPSDGDDSMALSYTNSVGYHGTDFEQRSEISSMADVEEMESFRFNRGKSSGSLAELSDEDFSRSSEEGEEEEEQRSVQDRMSTKNKPGENEPDTVENDNDRDTTLVSGNQASQGAEGNEFEDGEVTYEVSPGKSETEKDNGNNSGAFETNVEVEEEEKGQELGHSRVSVNFGKWKPDTEALRSGFLQETSKKAPPGYVVDENGNLVDLTPSSMKQRVVSEYSEMESGWNAFPANDNGEDIETIRDTKTLYDNNTIYNVPGLITNTETLPPLPTNIDTSDLNNEDTPSSPLDQQHQLEPPVSIPSTPNTTNKNVPATRTTAPASTVSTPTSAKTHTSILSEIDNADIGSIAGGAKDIPKLDINKIIAGKESHIVKLAQLEDYYRELSQFDTGVQAWINYTLRSSSKDNTDFIFEEYKNSKHVREAYANAEDINKKNAVITTVATVNQNVNYLRKKVLAHTMKPKNLFQSIGRKKL